MTTTVNIAKNAFSSSKIDFVSEQPLLGPELQAIASRIGARLKLKVLRAFNGAAPTDYTEAALQSVFHEIKARAASKDARSAAVLIRLNAGMDKVQKALTSDVAFTAFQAVDLTKVGQIEKVPLFRDLFATKLRTEAAQRVATDTQVLHAHHAGLLLAPTAPHLKPAWRNLRFNVNTIRCLAVNDAFLQGDSDEIMLSLTSVEATGKTRLVHTAAGLNDFDVGEVRGVSMPQSFRIVGVFPETFAVVVSLIEIDNGGAGAYLYKIYSALKNEIAKLASSAGEFVGSILSVPELGPVISQAIQSVVGELIGWLVGLLSDDYLGSFSTKVQINSASGQWLATGTDVLTQSRTIAGNDARYVVNYSWKLLP
ncbi:MAG: hypothetical protein ABI134_36270 [Byssovorax sp.]